MMLRIKYKQDKKNQWYGELLSMNGHTVWKTPRKYKRRKGVQDAVKLLQESFNPIGLN